MPKLKVESILNEGSHIVDESFLQMAGNDIILFKKVLS